MENFEFFINESVYKSQFGKVPILFLWYENLKLELAFFNQQSSLKLILKLILRMNYFVFIHDQGFIWCSGFNLLPPLPYLKLIRKRKRQCSSILKITEVKQRF